MNNKYCVWAGWLLAASVLSACGGGVDNKSNRGSSSSSVKSSVAVSSGSASSVRSSGSSSSRAAGSTILAQAQWRAGEYADLDAVYGYCVNPRPAEANPYYPDRQGTLLDEQLFIRSMIHDNYLWYREVVDRNPANYSSVISYFDALKTTAITASGKAKDEYHFAMTTEQAIQQGTGAATASHGAQYLVNGFDIDGVIIQVAHVVADSPAAIAGIKRGDRVVMAASINISTMTEAEIEKVVDALYAPTKNSQIAFTFKRTDGSSFNTTLVAKDVLPAVVDSARVLTHGDKTLGYVMLHNFSSRAEAELRDQFREFATAGVNELVLDLRYNGGGYIHIAAQLGYMIAGSTTTQGKAFAKTQFNDKHPEINPLTGEEVATYPFLSSTTPYFGNSIEALPTLNLSRVTVITSEQTCSASELIINGLRGAGITVNQVGSTTCGKPYGFYGVDNCGTTFYYVQMQTVNDQGFGDYADGFTPAAVDDGKTRVKGCTLGDDLTRELGDTAEQNFAAALRLIDGSSCSSPVARGATLAQASREGVSIAAANNPQLQMLAAKLQAAQASPIKRALLLRAPE